MTAAIAAPVLLNTGHQTAAFASGEATLDDWLAKRALGNMANGASRTYVVVAPETQLVIGYYALSMGHILNSEATGPLRRNMPQQIPAVVLGRLAVARDWQGQGLGHGLLRDAVARALRVSEEVSARILMVHALSPAAEAFYTHHGFVRLPVEAPAYALDLIRLRTGKR